MANLRCTLAAAALLLCAPTVRAQDFDAGAAMDMTGMGIYAMEPAVMDAARGGKPARGASDGKARSAAVPQADPTTFKFARSPAITKAVQAQFVKRTNAVDPGQATQLQQLFASQNLIGNMTSPLRQLGLDVNDVADAYTAYMIIAWGAANGRTLDPSRSQVAAARRQSSAAMMKIGIAKIAAGERQEIADACLIQGALLESALAHAKGNPAELQQVAAAARQGAAKFGMKLDSITLTEAGFAPK